ncbi:uncharacterized protein LOC144167249 [Haemaphysalis longicornis]
MGRTVPLDASPVASPPHEGVVHGLNLFNKRPLPLPLQMESGRRGAATNHTVHRPWQFTPSIPWPPSSSHSGYAPFFGPPPPLPPPPPPRGEPSFAPHPDVTTDAEDGGAPCLLAVAPPKAHRRQVSPPESVRLAPAATGHGQGPPPWMGRGEAIITLLRKDYMYEESWGCDQLMGRTVPLDASPVANPPHEGVVQGLNLFNKRPPSSHQIEGESQAQGRHELHRVHRPWPFTSTSPWPTILFAQDITKLLRKGQMYEESWGRDRLMGRPMPLDASPVATPPQEGIVQGLNLFNKRPHPRPDGGGEPRGRHEPQSSLALGVYLDQPLPSTLLAQASEFFRLFETKPEPVPAVDAKSKGLNQDGTAALVPFEMKTDDDELLKEYLDCRLHICSLDALRHKVLLGLNSSCSHLSKGGLGM